MKMPSLRFRVLRHEGIDEPHFDLLFEELENPTLLTFRSPSWPIHSRTIVQKLPNHRKEYLSYEGPIGRERGFVTEVVAGTFEAWGAGHGTRLHVHTQAKNYSFMLSCKNGIWELEPVLGS